MSQAFATPLFACGHPRTEKGKKFCSACRAKRKADLAQKRLCHCGRPRERLKRFCEVCRADNEARKEARKAKAKSEKQKASFAAETAATLERIGKAVEGATSRDEVAERLGGNVSRQRISQLIRFWQEATGQTLPLIGFKPGIPRKTGPRSRQRSAARRPADAAAGHRPLVSPPQGTLRPARPLGIRRLALLQPPRRGLGLGLQSAARTPRQTPLCRGSARRPAGMVRLSALQRQQAAEVLRRAGIVRQLPAQRAARFSGGIDGEDRQGHGHRPGTNRGNSGFTDPLAPGVRRGDGEDGLVPAKKINRPAATSPCDGRAVKALRRPALCHYYTPSRGENPRRFSNVGPEQEFPGLASSRRGRWSRTCSGTSTTARRTRPSAAARSEAPRSQQSPEALTMWSAMPPTLFWIGKPPRLVAGLGGMAERTRRPTPPARSPKLNHSIYITVVWTSTTGLPSTNHDPFFTTT